jgi:ketosteroid isomerase-like protein
MMNNRRYVFFLLLSITVMSLILFGCSPKPEIDAETVITEHFAALGNNDLDKAMSYVTDDAILWLAGDCLPRNAFRTANESRGPEITFEPSDFRVNENDVFFTMKVMINGEIVDPGSDAYAYVGDGKIKYTGDCETRK